MFPKDFQSPLKPCHWQCLFNLRKGNQFVKHKMTLIHLKIRHFLWKEQLGNIWTLEESQSCLAWAQHSLQKYQDYDQIAMFYSTQFRVLIQMGTACKINPVHWFPLVRRKSFQFWKRESVAGWFRLKF